tara:strand:- start:5458 stop:6012 length:555 start_codon:yes stop_codon:yes gene_type:complete
MSYFLGLDISTSCTGYSIFDSKGTLHKIGYIRLDSKKSVFSRASDVSKELSELVSTYEIQETFIEENLQAFRPGGSSAKTLLTLARFNGMISHQTYLLTDRDPIYVNVNSARKLLSLKLDRKSTLSTKEQVYDWVCSDLGTTNTIVDWPYKILKSGPRKGQRILDPAAYDMSDAYVICKAGMML